MNRLKHLMVAALAIALIGGHAAGLHAENRDRIEGKRGGAILFGLPGTRHIIAGLDLTSDQKNRIKTIFTDNKSPILQATRDLVESRLGMLQGLPDATMEFANARIQAMNLKKQILEQIKPILTPDQLSLVRERQLRKEERLQSMLERLDNRIGW